MHWQVDGRDSDGVPTLLVLYRRGYDTGLRVARSLWGPGWLVLAGGTVVECEPVGRYIDCRHAQQAAEACHGATDHVPSAATRSRSAA